MNRRTEIALVAVVVAVAGWFRLSNLDLTEYKGDEAVALDLTLPLIEGRELPKVGLVSSVGMKNPPMMMWLLAVPLLVDVDPLVATGFVGLLGAAAVLATYFLLRARFGMFVAFAAAAAFATAPWAVLYARKIWACDFLPPFTIALLHVLLAILERPKTKLVLWVPVLLCVLWQLHFSAFAAIAASGVVLAYAARRVRWSWLGIGVGVALMLLIPYLWHQATHGWEDFAVLGKMISGSGGRAKPPFDLRAFGYVADISGGLGWTYVTGRSTAELAAAVPALRWMGRTASQLERLLFVAALFLLAVRLVRRARVSRRYPFVEWGLDDERRGTLWLWIVGICGFFVVARLDGIYPHYFIITYPVSFVLAALVLDDLRRWVAQRFARAANATAIAISALMALGFIAFNVGFYGFVRDRGGTAGDYGTAFHHKDEVVRYAQENGLQIGSAPQEVTQLAALRRRYPRGDRPRPPGPPAGILEVRDTLRFGARMPCPAERAKAFGPLLTCIR